VKQSRIGGHERPVLGDAGAVHQHIDGTELRYDLRHHRLGILRLRDVAGDSDALPPLLR
jgi:hypothetical protein